MRFVVLGDLHYSDYTDPAHAAARDRLFGAFFQQVARLEADLVFAIGDTTNRGTMTEMVGLEEIAKATALPFVRIMGNHDCYSLSKPEISPFFLGGRPPVSSEQAYTSFDSDNIRFLLLDTARDRDYKRYDGFVSETQLAWLGQQIEEFNANPALELLMAFGHHPIYNTTRRSADTMLYIANSEAVHGIFNQAKSKPGFYFCGHNHCHSLAGPDAANWYHVQTADPLDCQSFRLITIIGERVAIEVINFDLSDPQLKQDFETARTSIEAGFNPQSYAWVHGQPHEHNLVVDLAASRAFTREALTQAH